VGAVGDCGRVEMRGVDFEQIGIVAAAVGVVVVERLGRSVHGPLCRALVGDSLDDESVFQ
jgi:hypothetical protein